MTLVKRQMALNFGYGKRRQKGTLNIDDQQLIRDGLHL